jgi:replicative DNA helicase
MEDNFLEDYEEATDALADSILDPADKVMPIGEIAKLVTNAGPRISTGFKLFDDVMQHGFKDGDLVIVSGQPGEGKTSFAQTLTYHLTKNQVPCLWFPYETTIEELDKKFIEMGISEHYLAYAPKKNTSGDIGWIKKKILESHAKYKTKVIVIDHIDFLTPLDMDARTDSREQLLKKITQDLKTLAIDLRIVIVLIAHVRKLKDAKSEPEMQDIGYSAGISQLADYIFMVSRIKTKKRDMGDADTGDLMTEFTRVKIVKNRQTGRLVFCRLVYKDSRFQNPENSIEEEVRSMNF